jgi:hypothetical protein
MRSSKIETAARVEEVFKLRLGGAEFADIRQFASAPERQWGVSDRQIWRYITAADRLVKERFDARAEHLLNRHILQRRQLYAHAMGAGDWATALRVLDSEAKLERLFPAERHEHTGKDGSALLQWAPTLKDLDNAELSLLAKLAERARQVATTTSGGAN